MTWPQRIERARNRTEKLYDTVVKRRNWLGMAVEKEEVVTEVPAPSFTPDDIASARDWGTCAFGEIVAINGVVVEMVKTHATQDQHAQMAPKDDRLKALGISFYNAVYANNVDMAETALLGVRRRFIELNPQVVVDEAQIVKEVDALLSSVMREPHEFTPRT